MNFKKLYIIYFILLITFFSFGYIYAIEPYKIIYPKTSLDNQDFNNIIFSDSGSHIIASKSNGNVCVWEAESCKMISSYSGLGDKAIELSSNKYGSGVVVNYSKYLIILKPKSLEAELKVILKKEAIKTEISHNNKVVIVGYIDGSVDAINIERKTRKEILAPNKSKLNTIQYFVSSERLLINYDDGTTYITNEDGSVILLSAKDEDTIISSALSKDSGYLISVHKSNSLKENILKIRSVYDFKLIGKHLIQQGTIKSVFANYNDNRFYLISETNEMFELKFSNKGNITSNPVLLPKIDAESLSLSPAIRGCALIRGKGQILETYDFDTKKLKRLSNNAMVENITTIESGTEAFASLSNSILARIDLRTGKVISEFNLPKGNKYILASNPQKRILAIASTNGKIAIYKYTLSIRKESIKLLNELNIGQKITCISILNNKEWILIGTDEGYFIAYNLKTGLKMFEIGTHNGRINAVKTTKDENYSFTAGNDGYIVRTLLKDNFEQIRVKNHTKAISLEISKSDTKNTYLISGGSEGKISVWNTHLDFKPVYSIEHIKSSILTITYIDSQKVMRLPEGDDFIINDPMNSKVVTANEFSDFVIASTQQGIDYLIRIPDVKIMHSFNQSQYPITNAELTEDSAFVLSIATDGGLHLYDTSYIIGYAYSSAGLYRDAIEYINKSYKLNNDSNNYEAIIRDRKKQAEILVKLDNPYDAIRILLNMTIYLEVNPISLDPIIEDGTIQQDKRDEEKDETIRDENLESKVIEDYNYVVIKPNVKDLEFISQQQLAYAEYSATEKFKHIIDNYIRIGDIYLEQFYDYSTARAYYQKAIKTAEKGNIIEGIALSYYKFALATQKYSIYVRRLKLIPEADALDTIATLNDYKGIKAVNGEVKDLYSIALGYETIGDLYDLRKEFGLSEEAYEQAYEIYNQINETLQCINLLKKLSEINLKANNLNNESAYPEVSLKADNLKKAFSYSERAIAMSEQYATYQVIGQLYNHQARLFIGFGHFKNALQSVRKARKMLEIHGSTEDIIDNMLIQSQFFVEVGDYDNSLASLEYADKEIDKSGMKKLHYAIINRKAYLEYKKKSEPQSITKMLEKNLENLTLTTEPLCDKKDPNNLRAFSTTKPLEAETYYLLYLVNRNNTFEIKQVIENYIRKALDISIEIYTPEYELYYKEAKKDGFVK